MRLTRNVSGWMAVGSCLCAGMAHADEAPVFRPLPLQRKITHVQPMTGIVLWTTSPHVQTDAIQLEYRYMKYGDIVKERGKYDWSGVEKLLQSVAHRKHQAILRFYDVYPNYETTVPAYIKRLPDYREVRAKSEGKPTSFSDWSHPELKRFALEFFTKFAERYDADPRLAFVQTGFGLWAEYHIYDGPMQLGKTFPDKAFQATFARHLAKVFRRTPWMISKDAAVAERAPYTTQTDLLKLPFGVFDDSFLCKQHKEENEPDWNALNRTRWQIAPAGGEFSYYTDHDQRNALAPNGPHGIPFERDAAKFHLTFMIGNDQPRYQPMERIRAASGACGYRFRVLAFETDGKRTRVTATNTGIAPIYYDAYFALEGRRSAQSLKGLLPGEKRTYVIETSGTQLLTIVCDRLVPGQEIEFEANL